ncbi:MAG: hypothetical protein ABJH06_16265 [Paraglaciecola sp.]
MKIFEALSIPRPNLKKPGIANRRGETEPTGTDVLKRKCPF